ncbi:MAG: endonuclease/exonuclease/phosphatase family protein [Lentimicrobium sp.]|nr:endonuclease/exonuclease/phosphatase family protein [Lentimicrobium sp.]
MFIMICCLIGLAVFLDIRFWVNGVLAVVVVIAFIIQFSYVFPYLPIAKKEMADGKGEPFATISMMMSNVLMDNKHYEQLIKLVNLYQPDILLAVETNDWWAQSLQPLDEYYKYSVKHPLENTYGMLLFSRIPLNKVQIKHLVKEEIPSIHTEITKDDFTFKLACIHPEPPAPEHADTSEPRDRELMIMANMIKGDPTPYMVIGDLNDVAWSDTSTQFAKISGLRDPRKGRGFFNTFHAKIPLMRFALDHAFFSDEFKVITLKRLPGIGSDHFPLYIECGVYK